MIKLTRLKEMIAEKGQTYKKCAAVIHVSPQTFTKKCMVRQCLALKKLTI